MTTVLPPQNHRLGGRGRPSPLADPEYATQVAEAIASGMTRADMAELFNVAKETITRWKKDPRVKVIAAKLIEDRVQQVARRVDSVIEGRLAHAESMSIRELLDIRREFATQRMRQELEGADENAVSAAAKWLEDNPEDAAAFDKLLNPNKVD